MKCFFTAEKKTDTRKINNFEEFNYDSLTTVKKTGVKQYIDNLISGNAF